MFSLEILRNKDLTNKNEGEKDTLSRDVSSLVYDKVKMDYYFFQLAKETLQKQSKKFWHP